MSQQEENKNKAYIVIGTNGTGKTSLVIEILKALIKQSSTYKRTNRALIMNLSNEEKWDQFPEVSINELPTFTGIRQLKPVDNIRLTDYQRYMPMLEKVYKYYDDGILVIDDAKILLKANLQDQMSQLLIKRRQKNADLFSIFHSLGQVPPSIYPYSTHLLLFATYENKTKWFSKTPKAESLEPIIKRIDTTAKTNSHYCEKVELKML